MSDKQFEYNEYINVMLAGVVTSIGENNVNFLIDEYKKGGCDYALDLLCDSLDKDENEISYAMRQALVIEAMNYMLEKQKFESDKGDEEWSNVFYVLAKCHIEFDEE